MHVESLSLTHDVYRAPEHPVDFSFFLIILFLLYRQGGKST